MVLAAVGIATIGAGIWAYGNHTNNSTVTTVGQTVAFAGLAVVGLPYLAGATGLSTSAVVLTWASTAIGLTTWRLLYAPAGSNLKSGASKQAVASGLRHVFGVLHASNNALLITPQKIPSEGTIVASGLNKFEDLGMASNMSQFSSFYTANSVGIQKGDFIYKYKLVNIGQSDVEVMVFEVDANLSLIPVFGPEKTSVGALSGSNVNNVIGHQGAYVAFAN